MDSNGQQNSGEKSQSKPSGGSNSNSHSRESNKNRNSSNHRSSTSTNDKSRNSSQGGKEKNNDNRRYQPRQEYRNNRYSSNRGSEDYKRNKNYNNKYTSDWNRRSNRSQNWHSSGPRYGNLSWQRNNPNQNQNLSNTQPEPLQIVGEYIKDYFLQQLKNPNGQEFLDQSHGYQTRFDRSFEAGDTSNYADGFTNDQGPRETNQEYHRGNHSSSKFSEPKNDSQKKGKPPKKGKPCSKPNEKKIQTPNNHSDKEPSNKSVGASQKPSQVRNNNRTKKHTPQKQGDLNEHANIRDTGLECGEGSIQKENTFTENSQPKNATRTHQEFISPNEEYSELENEPIPENQVTYEPPEDDPHQETTSVNTGPEIPNSQELLSHIKSELPDASDSDFDISNCLNVDSSNRFPSISVVPLSKLLKSELLDLNRTDIVVPTTPVRGRPTLRPNLVQRRKNSTSEGSLSENLVQRVANMDKVGIKNVINNSGTKYDAALKIQARKKLREEIRKQLKSMNFTPPENSENSVLVPDEIVDSLNIPAVVLDEIRKAFGIVLIEDKNMVLEQKKSLPPTAEEAPTPPPPASQPKDRPSKSPDLMSRLKMLTETKSQTEKLSPERPFVFTLNKHSKTKKTDNDVVLIESSSSSSSSSSSDSDSDSSSTSSNVSRTSSYKRRRRKKRILEANVVGNFEKLILPNLTEAQRRRYKDKYSKSTKGSLLYIYGICVRRSLQNTTPMDPKEKLKLKRNLSTADNAESLEFLMKAILSLFEDQKEKRRMSKEKSTATATSNHCNPVSPMKKLTDSTCNQRNSGDNGRGMVAQTESANTAQGSSEHQSTKVDKAPRPSPAEGANDANSAQGVSADEQLLTLYSDSDSVLNGSTGKGNNLSCSPSSRLWKSPGEKKCIELEASSPMSSIGMLQPPFGSRSLDLDAISSHSSIGNEAVSSIREIDVKLMELHKRKMYIEEMILKLQKDKMEVDLWTMRLQNEKFILLNSALANASSASSILAAAPKIDKKAKPTAKRKPFSTPFSEKLRNRKKRCQRDILLEDTDNVISKLGEKVSDMAKLMLLPRQTRQSISVSDNQTEASKTDGEVKLEEPPKEEEESVKVTLPQVDYTNVPNGNLEGWKLPITQIIVTGEAIVAASEDGNIYKFNIRTRALESKFSKHTEAITQIFTCPRENFVYTTSLDGFLKKTSIENFGLEIQSLNLQEPLQSIDIEWGTAYIGSRWGNIFTYDIKKNNLSETLLCSSESSIIAIKATKEGPRKVLIVSSKGNQIHFRDAMSGLLLRSLDVPDNLHIYSILLDGGCIYCGTQRNEIHQYNFTTGGRLAIFHCGNGAVSMKLYKEKYIFVGCYDGFVYVLDKLTGCQIGRFPGSGKMILALEIAGDKLITSAKDNTMQIIDIPKYIVTKDKS